MKNLINFLTPALVWGSTWFVITLQYGDVHPVLSVFWRFSGSTLIMFALCFLKRSRLSFSPAEHLRFFFLGIFLFCLNYLAFYYAEQFISSALVAVIFSGLAACNAVGSVLFLKKRVRRRTWVGAVLGLAGITVIYGGQIMKAFNDHTVPYLALAITFLGVFSASAGNLISQSNSGKGLPLLPSSAFGMFYGSLVCVLFVLGLDVPWVFEISPIYILGLGYLIVFGTVLAFLTYLNLISSVGSDKAGYVMVVAPIIAVTISFFFENFIPGPATLLGLILCLSGQVCILGVPKFLRFRPA